MIIKKKVHHPNDVSVKYFQATEAKELFNYFKLPGKFVKNYSPRVIKRDGSELDKEINKSNTNLTTETKHTKQKSKK